MKRNIFLAGLLALSLLGGCASSPAAAPAQPESGPQAQEEISLFPLTFQDHSGRSVTLEGKPERVVALFGSYAQTWLLSGGSLAGATSDAVDENRLEMLEDPDSLSLVGTTHNPNLEEILSLEPDFVILSSGVEEQVKVSQTLEAAGIPCAFFKVEMFEDYLSMLELFSQINGRPDLYEKNGLAVKEKIESTISRVPEGEAPTVLFVRAFSTGAKAKGDDNMTGAMLRDLKADNIASRHSSLLEELSMESIIAEDPDFILIVPMGSDSQKALDALAAGIQSNPAWNTLTAVENGRCVVLPRDLFHFKPNDRWGEAYEYLFAILYGEDA